MYISQLVFWSIVIGCLIASYYFYKSKDGRLRVLIIGLFLSVGWAHGVAGAYYLAYDLKLVGDWTVGIRILCNAPLALMIIRFVDYIRNVTKH